MTGSIERTFWRRQTRKTRSRDWCTDARRGGERSRAETVFRDIRAEFRHHPDFVTVDHGGRDATGDDDLLGDTGLWDVPTGEVLAKGSVGERVSPRTNWIQGYTNVADFAARSPMVSAIAPRFSLFPR